MPEKTILLRINMRREGRWRIIAISRYGWRNRHSLRTQDGPIRHCLRGQYYVAPDFPVPPQWLCCNPCGGKCQPTRVANCQFKAGQALRCLPCLTGLEDMVI